VAPTGIAADTAVGNVQANFILGQYQVAGDLTDSVKLVEIYNRG
jgi:hypothetical protein